jgi:lysophospholipid acyltransferase (LPLAT)-like uncharacterized protein
MTVLSVIKFVLIFIVIYFLLLILKLISLVLNRHKSFRDAFSSKTIKREALILFIFYTIVFIMPFIYYVYNNWNRVK